MTWFISTKFNNIQNFIHTKVDNTKDVILAKLEYHERHDDRRFEDVLNSIWELKLRQTAIEGTVLEPKSLKKEKKNSESL